MRRCPAGDGEGRCKDETRQSQNPPPPMQPPTPPPPLCTPTPYPHCCLWRVFVLLQSLQFTFAILNLLYIPCSLNAIPPLISAIITLCLSIHPRVDTLLQRIPAIRVTHLITWFAYLGLFVVACEYSTGLSKGLFWSLWLLFLVRDLLDDRGDVGYGVAGGAEGAEGGGAARVRRGICSQQF